MEISSILTDKSVYKPKERVTFIAYTKDISGYIEINYYRRDKIIDSQRINIYSNNLEWVWEIPSDDNEQYLAEIKSFSTNEDVSETSFYAINVTSDVRTTPIMGFLSFYHKATRDEQEKIINNLKRLHVNYLQYYDCYNTPEKLVDYGDNKNVIADSWQDMSRHRVRKSIIENYIKLAENSNIKNMLYVPWGLTSTVNSDGIEKDMLLYGPDFEDRGNLGKVPVALSGGKNTDWARYNLYKANTGSDSFKNHLFDSISVMINALKFDGIHFDTLGPNYDNTWTSEGGNFTNEFASKTAIPYFVNDVGKYFNTDSWKLQGDDISFGFNNVGGWGIDGIADNNNLDYLYAEQWVDMDTITYDDLFKTIKSIVSKSTWQQPIIPAYMHHDYKGDKTQFNNIAVKLTDLVIMSAGGSHLEIGEHMLNNEYFPDDRLSMSDELKDWLVKYYDFKVAYKNFLSLRDFSYTIHGDVSLNEISTDKVSVVEKFNDNVVVASAINTKNLNGNTWQDANLTREQPEKIKNVEFGFEYGKKFDSAYIVTLENPIPQKLELGEDNLVSFDLDTYAMVYAYKTK